MYKRTIVIIGCAALLGACGSSADDADTAASAVPTTAAATTAAPTTAAAAATDSTTPNGTALAAILAGTVAQAAGISLTLDEQRCVADGLIEAFGGPDQLGQVVSGGQLSAEDQVKAIGAFTGCKVNLAGAQGTTTDSTGDVEVDGLFTSLDEARGMVIPALVNAGAGTTEQVTCFIDGLEAELGADRLLAEMNGTDPLTEQELQIGEGCGIPRAVLEGLQG